MKKILFSTTIVLAVAGGAYMYAADHIDAPAVTGPNSTSLAADITDVYAFQSPSTSSNLVFVCNTQGLLSPAASGSAQFANNTMYEINIDNTGDNVEDLVLQCLVQNGKIRVYGPVAPAQPGTSSTVATSAPSVETNVTTYDNSKSGTLAMGTGSNGVKVFAGLRDDPFFFDLARFKEIIAGTQSSFRNPGVDTFAGTNVMSIIVEVPKSLLGTATTLNIWAESKTK